MSPSVEPPEAVLPSATSSPTASAQPLGELLASQRRVITPASSYGQIHAALAEMVAHSSYPCLGARSVFKRDAARVEVYDDMTSAASVAALSADLESFAADGGADTPLRSFLACFRGPVPESEAEFETLLWSVLQRLHDRDDAPWAPDVDSDPSRAHFAFSHHGTAYFIVGLHPAASRIARRAPLPVLVFNLHEQFERLRADEGFVRMRDTIRRRDRALQGTINPMVRDHGEESEARQYSGRAVEPTWQAPFVVEQ